MFEGKAVRTMLLICLGGVIAFGVGSLPGMDVLTVLLIETFVIACYAAA